jgi:hypothetical protein
MAGIWPTSDDAYAAPMNVRVAPHQVQAGIAEPRELALLERGILGRESPAARAVASRPGDQSVERHARR